MSPLCRCGLNSSVADPGLIRPKGENQCNGTARVRRPGMMGLYIVVSLTVHTSQGQRQVQGMGPWTNGLDTRSWPRAGYVSLKVEEGSTLDTRALLPLVTQAPKRLNKIIGVAVVVSSFVTNK